MSAAKAPAMTTRQAKRLNRKQTAQFEFTASQLRRADRQEEVEMREKKKQEKEQRRALNKRKREEQEEKQRAIKRRMLEEGKISIEDTWGRVTRKETKRINNVCIPTHSHKDSETVNLRRSRGRIALTTAIQRWIAIPRQSLRIQLIHTGCDTALSKRGTSPGFADAKEKEELLLLMDKFEDDIIVAEDATAEIIPSPPVEDDLAAGSFRSVLSEMTVANVNTRAQEKPDTTSVPEGSGLATPSKPRDPFADNDQLAWDKENTDPLHIYSSAKATPKAAAKLAITDGEKSEAGPSSCRKRLRPSTTDRIVDLNGSPRKLTASRDALVKPSPLTYINGKIMPALPRTGFTCEHPSSSSSSF
ncbi:hypothetical protein DV738_g2311, partial [Chaetothyriales sp. CBS 135597]